MAGPHGWVDGMRCIACESAAVTERPERTAQGYRRFRCRACGKQFDERTGGLLNRTQYPSDVVALVVLWRLRYKLALRDLPARDVPRPRHRVQPRGGAWVGSEAHPRPGRGPAVAPAQQGGPELVRG